MTEYHVQGTTFTNIDVNDIVKAVSRKHALSIIQRKYGSRLRNPEIFIVTQLEDVAPFPEAAPQRAIEQLLPDVDILRIARAIRYGAQVDPDEYRLFRNVFTPMIRSIVQDLWTDVTIMTKADLEEELYGSIITEFLPKYSPERGRLLGFIRMKVRNRIIRRWKREKYKNAEKPQAEAKHEILEDLARRSGTAEVKLTREQEIDQVMNACKRIYEKRIKLERSQRRTLYSWIVRLGLHKELVRSEKQRQALELIYGSGRLILKNAASELGLTHPTIHRNMARGEANILKNAAKILSQV